MGGGGLVREGATPVVMAKKLKPLRLASAIHDAAPDCIPQISPDAATENTVRHPSTHHDVTRAKRYEFLANMSREIRAPLNGVLGMAELLAQSDLDSRQKTFVEIIVKSGNSLLSVINDLLDFSMIDAGRLALDPAPFSLVEMLENAMMLLAGNASEKNIELIMRVQPDLHDNYLGDAQRLRQMIVNLLGNAVKFTDTGHVLLDVSGEYTGTQSILHISVTDTGIGIPQHRIARIFDGSDLADTSTRCRHHGMGLGLAIASRLVAMMGGKISVHSREGHGSTFHVALCLPHAVTSSKQQITPADILAARILIVDDNPVSRATLVEQMAFWGFNACAAQSGEEGLRVLMAAAALNLAPDCLVLDHQMPGMSGAEMLHIMNATPGIMVPPVIMLTSADRPWDSAFYRALPIDQHIMKPARSSALFAAIVALVRKGRANMP